MATHHESTYRPKTRIEKWLDDRLPLPRMMHGQFVDFPTPRNINYLWTTGGLLTFFLVAQIATGIVLAMHFIPSAGDAFNSVEHIRRDVNYGWLLRNMHAVGASMFFIAVYIHIARGLYYGSYKAPREVLWIIGVVILLLMMATAFMGYSLPWGQMSFWAVTVITNLFSSRRCHHPGPRHAHRAVAVGRLLGVGHHADALLCAALPHAVRDRGRGGAAHLGAARGRPEQPDRARDQDGVGLRAHEPLRRHEGHLRAQHVHHPVRVVRVLRARLPGPPRQLHRGQPALDAAAHRAGVVLPALLRDPARHPRQAAWAWWRCSPRS